MIYLKYKTKDLNITTGGATLEEARGKLLSELWWFRARFPNKKYPASPRKFTISYT